MFRLLGGKGGGGHFIRKAYVQKVIAVSTRLKIGVPLFAEDSGATFPNL